MELTKQTQPIQVSYVGTTKIIMPAGARLRFQNTDDQGNFLDEQVPVGKQWNVCLQVRILETGA